MAIIMKWLKKALISFYEHLNKQSNKQVIISMISAFISILYPITGVVIFFISLFTKEKVYGKVALICAFIAMLFLELGKFFYKN